MPRNFSKNTVQYSIWVVRKFLYALGDMISPYPVYPCGFVTLAKEGKIYMLIEQCKKATFLLPD